MNNNSVRWIKNSLSHFTAAIEGFIKAIYDSEPDFDFAPYAESFAELPDLCNWEYKVPELSRPARKFFEKIYLLNVISPEIALKIITILVCSSDLAFYTTKLKETVLLRLEEWLIGNDLPCRQRLEWGLFCWNNWPISSGQLGKNLFAKPLLKLCSEEAAIDPDFVLSVFDDVHSKRHRNSYIFSPFFEDPQDFIEFARAVEKLRPSILIDALIRFVEDGKKGFGGYSPDLGKLREACNELHMIAEKNESLNVSVLGEIYRVLILYSYPDLPWYNSLHEKLWEIEKSKSEPDANSVGNHFIVGLNTVPRDPHVNDIRSSLKALLDQYKGEEHLGKEQAIERTGGILRQINGALHRDYPTTRNRSFSEPNNSELVDDVVQSYWEMVGYLRETDKESFLYSLETALEKPTFTVAVTDKIGDVSRQVFISEFLGFSKENIDKGASLVSYMVGRSGYTNIEVRIRDVLDIVYPLLFSLNQEAALKALNEGLRKEHGHMHLWRPKSNVVT